MGQWQRQFGSNEIFQIILYKQVSAKTVLVLVAPNLSFKSKQGGNVRVNPLGKKHVQTWYRSHVSEGMGNL